MSSLLKQEAVARLQLKKYRLALIGALLAVPVLVGVIYWNIAVPQGPMVDGKSLNFWLDEYSDTLITGGGGGALERHEKSEAAIRKLGTNAIPQLLHMLQERDGKVTTKLLELLGKQRLIRISYKPAWVRNYEAELGFRSLGADAKPAVPALLDIYERGSYSSAQRGAALALSNIGPAASAAIPSLLRGTTNSDAGVRLGAVIALGSIRSEPETVIPALIRCVNDTSASVRMVAARSLGNYGPEARQAVPALVNAKKKGNINGNVVDMALKQIESETATNSEKVSIPRSLR